MRWRITMGAAGLAILVAAAPEVFDLGALDQYKSKQQEAPSLTGNSIWLTGSEEKGGFDLGLSPDVKAKVQGVLEACGQADDKCYQDTRDVLRSANLDIDNRIERRDFRHLLSKTVKGALGYFLDIAAMLYISWEMKFKDQHGEFDSFAFIPVSKAGEAAKLETATDVLVSAEGTAIATIKPTPHPTSLKGPHAPSITAVTSAHDGLAQGDFVVSLDEGLASRMQEIMMREMDCEDGSKFEQEHSTKRRAASRMGKAICAYQAVLINMGGTLSDLMQTDLGGLDFAIPTMPAERAAAYEYTLELTEDYAPFIDLQVDRVRALAAYLFAITIGVTLEGKDLGAVNKIPSTLIQTGTASIRPTQTTASPSSSSSSGCPDPTSTPLFCGYEEEEENHCKGVRPKTKGESPKCAEDGKFPNCPCNMPVGTIITFVSQQEMKAIDNFAELFRTIKIPEPQPKPSPQPEAPKGPTKALTIISDQHTKPKYSEISDAFKIYWNFFTTDYGKPVGCRNDPVHWETRPLASSFAPGTRYYPGGEFPLVLFGENCKYMNSGDNVGKLFCGDNERAIDCFWDPPEKDPNFPGKIEFNKYECKKEWTRQTVFTCPF
ncbi:hypothetical protein FB567DRAFT_529797 [Paraphoma chrysanthemicola]|uniref:Uncharacterized protein n=1 Tax=Paraphoma chrysanthemicola TaxID=798071 RepID=A0A8K0R2S7_9PLEO|nr:hypothetical protein FB567DRAFT_529797 [Paraphoma chrysanthemicola]